MKQRKPVALLAYLAVNAQRYNRDTLAELLYPAKDRDHAFSGFRECLFLLRSAIGEHWLATEQDGVALPGASGLWVDVREMRRMLEEAGSAERSGNEDACLDRLAAAAGLFRGEFLSGFYLRDSPGFEQWQQSLEESLRQDRCRILQRLVGMHEERGELRQAIGHCRSWLAVNPLEEEAHRRLMLLHALAGERGAALKQYERCREILKAELKEQPEQETEKLRERIAEGRITPAPARRGPAPVREGVSVDTASQAATVLSDPPGSVAASYPRVAAGVIALVESREAAHTKAVISWGALPERAALLLELAHPGQVLLSAETAEQLAETPPRGASLRSLGVHRLKDLGPPLEILQLVHPNLPQEHPGLQSLDSRPNNLKSQPTAFVGRQGDLATVVETLRRGDVRLLTLTGAGGTGKTRLALQAAAVLVGRFEHGAFFVDLAPLRDPALVPKAVADALELRPVQGDNRPVSERVSAYLRSRRMLLVLDNFEHLMAAAGDVADLLVRAPRLSVIVTSVEPLRISAEHEMRVPPLEVPTGGMDLRAIRACAAVDLFARRAAQRHYGFSVTEANAADVAEICVRLDGLPLALELAAARLDVLTTRALRDRLDSPLSVLTTGPRDLAYRQQVLRREIDWSHDLLGDRAQEIFRRLAVFPASFDLDAAQAVCGDVLESLADLVRKSLVVREEHEGQPRFRLLQTIRDYAMEKLAASGEAEQAREALFFHLLGVVEEAGKQADGPGWKEARVTLHREEGNVREILRWLRDTAREEGLRFITALGLARRHWAEDGEDRSWLEQFHDLYRDAVPCRETALLAEYLGWARYDSVASSLPLPESSACFEESIRIAQACGDLSTLAQAQVSRGWAGQDLSQEERAFLANDAIKNARASGDPYALSWCLVMVATGREWNGRDFEPCRKDMEEALALAEKLGSQPYLAHVANAMGRLLWWSGKLAEAEPWLLRADEIAWEVFEGPTFYSVDLPGLYLAMRLPEKARPFLRRALAGAVSYGDPKLICSALARYAILALREGKIQRAARLTAAAAALTAPGSPGTETKLREELSPKDQEVFEAESAAGRTMSLDQAVAYAQEDW